jgi:hypothetical protein
MIGQTSGIEKSVKAGAAVTACTVAKFGTDDDTMIVAAANTDLLVGVFQHDAASGAEVRVMLTGISRLKLGTGGITRGALVTVDASGQGIALSGAAGVNVQAIGIAMASGVAGDIVPVLIAPSRPQQ